MGTTEAAIATQGTFWQMHDLLLENYVALTDESLARLRANAVIEYGVRDVRGFYGSHSRRVQRKNLPRQLTLVLRITGRNG
jgi:hypothetical protein